MVSDITRALIKSLPRLFTKHQTDEARIAVVLSIPLLMNLDLYLEMGMTTVSRLLGVPFVSLKYLTGLYQSVGRYHQAVYFPLVAGCPLACCGNDPLPDGRDQLVQHE